MKKIFLVLFMSLCLMFAVGCGSKGEEIKREEAVALLSNIDNVEVPEDGITMEATTKTKDDEYTVKVVYSKTEHIAYSLIKGKDSKMEAWIYAQEDKLISAMRMVNGEEETKGYNEITVTEATLDAQFAVFGKSIEGSIDFKGFISSVLEVINNLDNATEEDKIDTEKYYSKGDGNLTAEIKATIDGEEGTMSVSIDKGIVRSLKISSPDNTIEMKLSFTASIKKPSIDDTWTKGF